MISWAAASPLLSDKENFPVVSRTVGPYTKMSNIILKLMEHFDWKNCAILGANDDLYSATSEQLLSDLEDGGYNVMFYQSFTAVTADVGSGQKSSWMSQLRSTGVRIIFVLAYCGDMRDVLLTASDLGMLEGYAYLFFDVIEDCHADAAGLGDGRDEEARALFHHVLSVTWYTASTARYEQFVAEMDARRLNFSQYSHPPSGPLAPTTVNPEWLYASVNDSTYDMPSTDAFATIGGYASFLYDAIYLYYLAANDTLAAGFDPRHDGMEVVERVKGRSFAGMSGNVVIDENGDRSPDILLNMISIEGDDYIYTDVGLYESITDSLKLWVNESEWGWPGNSTTIPVDLLETKPNCQERDYYFTVSACDARAAARYVQFFWNETVACEGGVKLPSTVLLECDQVPFASATGRAVCAVCTLGAGVGLVLLGAVVALRRTPDIKASQPVFLGIFVGAAVAVTASNVLGLGPPTAATCLGRAWLFHLAFTAMFGALFLKAYRVWRIFGNKNLRRVKVTVAAILRFLGGLLLVDVALLGTWTVLAPPVAETTLLEITNVGAVPTAACRGSPTFGSLLGMYHVGLVLIGAYISYQTRMVSDKFSESKYIMFAIYQIALIGGLTLMVVSFDTSLSLQVMMGALGWTFSTISAVCVVVLPKLLRLWKPEWFPAVSGYGTQTGGVGGTAGGGVLGTAGNAVGATFGAARGGGTAAGRASLEKISEKKSQASAGADLPVGGQVIGVPHSNAGSAKCSRKNSSAGLTA